MSTKSTKLLAYLSVIMAGQSYPEQENFPRFEDLPDQEQKRLLQRFKNDQLKKEQDLAIKRGLKKFEFFFNGQRVVFYALNQKSADKKAKKLLEQMIYEAAIQGMPYPDYKVDKNVSIAGLRKFYEYHFKHSEI